MCLYVCVSLCLQLNRCLLYCVANSTKMQEGNDIGNTSTQDSSIGSNMENVLDRITDSSIESICASCNKLANIDSMTYIQQRADLKLLLNQSFEGIELLASFDVEGKLTEDMYAPLTQIIISREMRILCKKNNFSATNILQKLE